MASFVKWKLSVFFHSDYFDYSCIAVQQVELDDTSFSDDNNAPINVLHNYSPPSGL